MSLPLYNSLVMPTGGSANSPSIQAGGGLSSSTKTGIYAQDEVTMKLCVNGTDVATINASGITGTIVGQTILVFTSAAGAGGAATEAMTLTGLLSTDTILSVSQKTKGGNSLPLLGFSTQVNNALTGIWSADPGSGSVIIVSVKR